ncbi:MAG: alpha-ketoglutarate-dependent dioxygenase AlkB [Asticcacaulis sp.]
MTQPDLFSQPSREGLAVLRGFVLTHDIELLSAVEAVIATAPLRRMQVPGGGQMSVAMSNCGAAGWTSDLSGYRYAPADPLSGKPWPVHARCHPRPGHGGRRNGRISRFLRPMPA